VSERLQQGSDIILKIYGDSAYFDNDYLGTGGGRGIASCRETVEWTSKDDKGQWKYYGYKNVLQLRGQPLAKIMFICLLLRNAYVTLNGSQVSEYLVMMPPSFEEWTSQGPQVGTMFMKMIVLRNMIVMRNMMMIRLINY
jgi:hypothetical protein